MASWGAGLDGQTFVHRQGCAERDLENGSRLSRSATIVVGEREITIFCSFTAQRMFW